MISVLLAALLVSAARAAPLTLRFYPAAALLINGSVPTDDASVGLVSVVGSALKLVEPDSPIIAVARFHVQAKRIAFKKRLSRNVKGIWRDVRGSLEYRGRDEDDFYIYTKILQTPKREAVFDVWIKAKVADRSVRPRKQLINAELEVSCSNGIFCDGPERYIDGICFKANPLTLPCVYGEGDCYVHECIEEKRTCALQPIAMQRGESCDTCNSEPKIISRISGAAASVGAAAPVSPADGTCEAPKPLFAAHHAEAGEETWVVRFASDGTSTSTKMTASNAPASSTVVPVEGIRMRVVQKSTDGFNDVVRPVCSGARSDLIA